MMDFLSFLDKRRKSGGTVVRASEWNEMGGLVPNNHTVLVGEPGPELVTSEWNLAGPAIQKTSLMIDGVTIEEKIQNEINDAMFPTAIFKCSHCGQWGCYTLPCASCGAPIDK